MPVGAAKSAFSALLRTLRARTRAAKGDRPGQAAAREAKPRSFLEKIPAVTYVLEVGEPSGTVYCSPQVEAMLGYPPEAYEKDRTHWVKVLHPDDRERVLAEDARACSTGEPFGTASTATRAFGTWTPYGPAWKGWAADDLADQFSTVPEK
jgi:PAS domain-containing protein